MKGKITKKTFSNIELNDNDTIGKKIDVIKKSLHSISFGYDAEYIVRHVIKSGEDNGGAYTDLARIYEHITNAGLIETIDERYRGMVRELYRKLLKENNCKTELEKALVEITVNSYVRILDGSRRINNEFNAGTISLNRTAYIAQISKLKDRSHRQMIQSIQTLNSLKNVTTKITINADTAFIANNQQLNNTNEINDAK